MANNYDSEFKERYKVEDFWEKSFRDLLGHKYGDKSSQALTSSGLKPLINKYDELFGKSHGGKDFADEVGDEGVFSPKAPILLKKVYDALGKKDEWERFNKEDPTVKTKKGNNRNRQGKPEQVLNALLTYQMMQRDKKYSGLYRQLESDDTNQVTLTGQERFQIWFGAPGTGKSHHLQQVLLDQKVAETQVVRTTLYPDYSYQDFVGSIMPQLESSKDKDGKQHDKVVYKFEPGVFATALLKAITTDSSVVLVIEEMSRANVAAVFGDVFQLLDLDDDQRSRYPIQNPQLVQYLKDQTDNYQDVVDLNVKQKLNHDQIVLPPNLYIWGTMNTSDQNVFVMDTAFKRRFAFKYVTTTKDDSDDQNESAIFKKRFNQSWGDFYAILNDYIVGDDQLGLSEDKQLGYHFLKFNNDDEHTEHDQSQIQDKLLLYLWQDVDTPARRMNNQRLFKASSFGELIAQYQANTENKLQIFSQEFQNFLESKTNQGTNHEE